MRNLLVRYRLTLLTLLCWEIAGVIGGLMLGSAAQIVVSAVAIVATATATAFSLLWDSA
jgi:hypothetical protein